MYAQIINQLVVVSGHICYSAVKKKINKTFVTKVFISKLFISLFSFSSIIFLVILSFTLCPNALVHIR